MPLSDHEQWAKDTGTEKGPWKINQALQSLEDEDREVALKWLRDPSWPHNRVARALRRYGEANANPKCATVNHNNVQTWRASNDVRMAEADGA